MMDSIAFAVLGGCFDSDKRSVRYIFGPTIDKQRGGSICPEKPKIVSALTNNKSKTVAICKWLSRPLHDVDGFYYSVCAYLF
jgi:hypothetical protein